MTTTDSTASFAEKVALGTGAGGGIGRATAVAFAQAGADGVLLFVMSGIDEQHLRHPAVAGHPAQHSQHSECESQAPCPLSSPTVRLSTLIGRAN